MGLQTLPGCKMGILTAINTKKDMTDLLSKAFGFVPGTHKIRTELIAGFSTFLTMAYILAVNPMIFSALPDMPKGAVFTATALAAVVSTLVMAFYAKKPFALAPGMGLNAFFVYTVCISMHQTWQFALTAVLIEGIIFIILSATKVRTMIVNSIPVSLKNAIGAGIGLFIAFIGLQGSQIVVDSPSTLVTIGDISQGPALLAIIGIAITAVLLILKVRGGILLGILGTTLIGLFIKDPATGEAVTKFSGSLVSYPESISPIFCKFDWNSIFSFNMLIIVFTFLFNDIFNTIGTVIGVSHKAGFVDKEGNIDGIDKIFMADAIGTVFGAFVGTSTTTTYVESAAGVGDGGRTGLTAFFTALFFAVAMLFSGIFLAVPAAATAPALILVGMMMMEPIVGIDWKNFREAIPAFITIVIMICTYSIADGILIGSIAYVLVNALTGKAREISLTMWILFVLFVLKYIFI